MKFSLNDLNALWMGCILIAFTTAGCAVGAKKSSPPALVESQNKIDTEQNLLKNPCWFRLPVGAEKQKETQEAYEKYMNRETFGYPQDIPVQEAVKIFNDEAYCKGPDPKRPPLTEQEVKAGAIGEIYKDGTEPVSPSVQITTPERQAAMEMIWKTGVMPKGSLIVGEGYSDIVHVNKPEEGTVTVDCWKIYIYLGLDKKPREGDFLNPEQVCLIRKTCFGIKLSKH